MQKFGVDYFETFSPSVRINSVRFALALAIHLSCTVFQLDVKTAYLNATLEQDVFIG